MSLFLAPITTAAAAEADALEAQRSTTRGRNAMDFVVAKKILLDVG